jgi:hypothetical protein
LELLGKRNLNCFKVNVISDSANLYTLHIRTD